MFTERADELAARAESLGAVLFQQEVIALRKDIDGCFYSCRAAEKPVLRGIQERAKDMGTWHVLPIWGPPSWEAFQRLTVEYLAVYGLIAGHVTRDLFKREVRKYAAPAVFAVANHQCVRCGSPYRLEVDHIVPTSRRGLNYGQNFQTLCRDCNRAKGDDIWWPGIQEPKR